MWQVNTHSCKIVAFHLCMFLCTWVRYIVCFEVSLCYWQLSSAKCCLSLIPGPFYTRGLSTHFMDENRRVQQFKVQNIVSDEMSHQFSLSPYFSCWPWLRSKIFLLNILFVHIFKRLLAHIIFFQLKNSYICSY